MQSVSSSGYRDAGRGGGSSGGIGELSGRMSGMGGGGEGMPPPGNGGMSVAGVDLQSVADVFVLPGRIMGSNHNNTNVVNVSDPTALLHQQLASALLGQGLQ